MVRVSSACEEAAEYLGQLLESLRFGYERIEVGVSGHGPALYVIAEGAEDQDFGRVTAFKGFPVVWRSTPVEIAA